MFRHRNHHCCMPMPKPMPCHQPIMHHMPCHQPMTHPTQQLPYNMPHDHMMGTHNMPEQYDGMDYSMMPHMDDQQVMGDYDMGHEPHMMNMPYDMAPQHMDMPHHTMGDYDMQMPHHQQLPYNMPHQGNQMMPEHQYPQHYPQKPSCSCGKKKR
ncbi:hypothetical protein M1E11_06335 [Bacillus sp. JZ8]